ncbi:amino acid adenylation domain-containing protein [Variovorax dokdonensis]|uniref:Amino acid adenylation domain-containing protein n=1 Tax=Variovorax dokdonensis TaxID=344883 RepID=A0ABT7N5I3_9BURK|nr:non-ribosomal peptide synthetase [Variovorax dokdonensis]MDM0043201.1 amino acid adenylation domain-containing protein [Variovorax dokdonensis]
MNDMTLPSLLPDAESVDYDPFGGGAEVERVVPSSQAQREVWLADRLSTQASLAYNEAVRLRLRGALDIGALQQALDALVARHDSLRTSFSSDGLELLVAQAQPVMLEVHDLQSLSPEAREARLAEAFEVVVKTPFPLDSGPLYRAALFTFAPDDHVLVQSAHHAVCDGWSWSVLNRDLGRLYACATGQASAPAAAPSYADYVLWEQEEAQSADMQAHIQYWVSRFSGSSLPVLELPLDRKRAKVRTFTSRRVDHVLDRQLVDALRKFGARRGTSLYAVMLAGFATLMHRLSEQDDLVVGIAAAGQLASEMHELVGHCVNLLPLRFSVDGNQAFEQLACKCGDTLLDAFEHQSLTYGSLLQKLAISRDPSRLPLVSVLFNIDQDANAAPPPFGGLCVETASIPRVAENFELFVNGTPVPAGMQLEAQYNSDLYDEATVARWLRMYEQLLRHAVEASDCPVAQLNLLSQADRQALGRLQPPATPLPQPALMHAAFAAQARLHPQRFAMKDQDRRWTYAELDQQTNQLAHAMRARGIGRGHRVGICLERGADMMVGILATLKCGAAYVPLDPAFPQARLDFYAQDAALGLLLTHDPVKTAPQDWCADASSRVMNLDGIDASEWPSTPLPSDPALDPQAEDAAYVIYTSGSTGKPKGVVVPHRAAANFLESMRKAPGLSADDKLAAVTTLSFDMSVPELHLPLAVGAELVMVPRDVAMDGMRLRQMIEDEGITVLQATPGRWRLLLDAEWRGSRGFRGWIGAESVPAGLSIELLARCGELWNLYGPTETTVWSTLWKMDRQAIESRGVAIGTPMDNTTVWILDRNMQPCPVGVPGEICIGGAGVTLGYHDRPELTAERFVVSDVGGEPDLIYRTGDRGRWRNDGLLEHLGRFDFQVKVRGYRIELGEIEARCNEVPGVARSVVVVREDQPDDVRLVAYLSLSTPQAFDAAALDRHLRATLPQYMVPQHVVPLDALPLLPNGKIDRKALPAPAETRSPARGERVAPANDRERAVLQQMEEVLNLPGLSAADDFFALGGHSLLAARLVTLLGKRFELTIPLVTVFEAPTAQRMAEAIDALARAGTSPNAAIEHRPERDSAPLTPMQERIVFIEQLYPGRSIYNAPSGHRLIGQLDVASFEAAFRDMVARQSALRTTFTAAQDGTLVQRVARKLEFEFPLIDLGDIPAPQREQALAVRMQEIADQPIDIARGPLFHVALFRLGPQEHAFAFVPHHLVWDGWSFDLYQKELSALYLARVGGQASGLPEVSISMADYACWLQDWMASPQYDSQLAFWKRRFSAARPAKALGTDMPRQAGMTGTGAMHPLRVDAATTERLQALARRLDVTLSMLTLSVFALMMSDAVGSEAVVVANPVRGRESPGLETTMGFFNNVMPLPFDIDRQQTFAAFCGRVKAQMLEAMRHQQIPFERLVAEPEFQRHVVGGGVYQGLFSFQDARERPTSFCGLEHQQIHLLQRGATDDLSLWVMEKPTGLEGAVNFNADIFLPETGLAFRERFLELLDVVAKHADMPVGQVLQAADSPHGARLRQLSAQAPAAPQAKAQQADQDADSMTLLLPEQARLAQVWASLLGLDVNDIHPTDNFFDLGGDSLTAMRAVARAQEVLGLRVEPRRYVFESLAQLAVPAPETEAVKVAAPAPAPVAVDTRPSSGLFGRVMSAFGKK